MPVRHFERVRELLRDQERLCVASIEVSEQWRTQGGKKVKRNEYFKKIKPRLEARMLSRSFRAVQRLTWSSRAPDPEHQTPVARRDVGRISSCSGAFRRSGAC